MYTYLQEADDGLPMRSAGPWAAEKLDYLARYIAVFTKSMRGKWQLNYIDLQAGPGKNLVDQTGEILLGSPLLALTTQFPFAGYYFVEYDKRNASALEARCAASSLLESVQLTTGDCNQIVNAIVEQLKPGEHQSLNLAFLDPEGLELNWSTIASLASVRRMDMIINYPQSGLTRYMPKAFVQDAETAIDEFFGSREWRPIYEKYQTRSSKGLQRELIDLYLGGLQALGYKDVLRDDEVGDEPLMRNAQRSAPLYRLLFASKHRLGKTFWKEITKRDVYGQRRLFDA